MVENRQFTIIAQDPSVHQSGRGRRRQILRAAVEVPAEDLRAGPWGYRVQVVDYDTSSRTAYRPYPPLALSSNDPYERASDGQLLADPRFHCQNVYALVMRTLARFERALGRRLGWGFYGHHLIVVPHAFCDANAYYSSEHHALLFGYFRGKSGRTVFTCLSHDVVVHETTHALLDGLRERFSDPSSPDQAAFHEGFADVVALLSVFSLSEVVAELLRHTLTGRGSPRRDSRLIAERDVNVKALRSSGLVGLAAEVGGELSVARGNALRRSAELVPSATYYHDAPEFREPHRRGEIFVAAVMNTFLEIWSGRVERLREVRRGFVERQRVVEEGAEVADLFLDALIRAIDYTPPAHLEFGDYLSAVLTSDFEMRPNDEKYQLRRHLRETFGAYGIVPASSLPTGHWAPAPAGMSMKGIHLESMRSAPDEVFRFVWQNAAALKISPEAYSRVLSVRPTRRIGSDGFWVEETVAEHHQTIIIQAGELKRLKIAQPAGMPDAYEVRLRGGGTLIFDEYGYLKYHVHNDVSNVELQTRRLRDLWELGTAGAESRDYSQIHRLRGSDRSRRTGDEW